MITTKKALSIAVAAGFAFQVGAVAMPAQASAAEADTAAMQQEIQALSARLAQLEGQLKAVKSDNATNAKTIKKMAKKQDNIVWSGSIKSGYWDSNEQDSSGEDAHSGKIKSEFVLDGKAKLKDGYSVHIGVKFKNTNEETKKTEKNKLLLQYASVTKTWKLGDGRKFDVTIGTDKVTIGEGLWFDKSATYTQRARWDVTKRDNLMVAYGRDSHDYQSENMFYKVGKDTKGRTRVYNVFQWTHNFGDKDNYLGVYYGHQQPETYWGVFGNYEHKSGVWVKGEYIRNTNTDKGESMVEDDYKKAGQYGYLYTGANAKTKGYLFQIGYGHAKKKGTYEAIIEWLHADQNLFMDDNYSGWDDYLDANGFHGWSLQLGYALSDSTKVSLLKYWGRKVSDPANLDADKQAMDSNLDKNSIYLKVTTKF